MNEIFNDVQTDELVKIVKFIKNSDELSSAQQNPSQFLAKFGINLPANYQYELYLNDETTLYIIVPTPNKIELTHEVLEQIHAGAALKTTVGTLSSLGSVSTALCIGTVTGTWGSGSTIACIVSAGTASTAKV